MFNPPSVKNIYALAITIELEIESLSAQQFDFTNIFGGPESTQCKEMTSDFAGNIFIAGHFGGTTDLDLRVGIHNTTSTGEDDIVAIKMDASGSVLWAKTDDDLNDDIFNTICIDPDSNVILAGSFSGTINIYFGPNEYNLASIGFDNIFIQKLNTDSDLLWGVSAGGDAADHVYCIMTDQTENVIAAGSIRNTGDFNFHSGVNTLSTTDFPDAFVWKLSSRGDRIWAKALSGLVEDLVGGVAVDDTGRTTIVGTFYQTTNFDPSTSTFNFKSEGAADIYVAQLEADDTFVTTKKIGGFGYDVSRAITLGNDGAPYFTSYYQLTLDFESNVGVEQLSSQCLFTIFVAQWNNDGTCALTKGFKGSQIMNKGNYIVLEVQNYVLITRYYFGNTDVDPTGITQIGNSGNSDFYIKKLSNEGNYIRTYRLGNSSADRDVVIAMDDNGGVYMMGYFYRNIDFNPFAGSYPLTAQGHIAPFVIKISEAECSNLSHGIVATQNINCVFFRIETAVPATGNVEPYSYVRLNIESLNVVTILPIEEGICYVTLTDGIGCERTTGEFENDYDTPAFFSIEAYITGGQFGSLINSTVNVIAFNNGFQLVNATIKLLLTSNCTFIESDKPETHVAGDRIMWFLLQINWNSYHFSAKVKLISDPSLPFCDSPCFKIFITPNECDIDKTVNEDNVCYFFQFSRDPNDKQVSPLGACDKEYTLHDEQLHFNVRFQNIGNALVENVYMHDTLSKFFDINTFRVLGTSYDLFTEILSGKVIKYRFDNIQLPDSTSEFEGNQGFLFFCIDLIAGMQKNMAANNSVAIYFDLNDQVITNETSNTFVSSIFQCIHNITDNPTHYSTILQYLNPASHYVNLRVSENVDEMSIFDQFGQLIHYLWKTKEEDIIINTACFAGGSSLESEILAVRSRQFDLLLQPNEKME